MNQFDRGVKAAEATFTMTADHLARAMEATRRRERARIATYLDEQADIALAAGEYHDTERRLREAAEYVRTGDVAVAVPAVALVRDPLEAMTDNPPGVLDDDGSGLPPVRILDDEAEGSAMVRNLDARGKLKL